MRRPLLAAALLLASLAGHFEHARISIRHLHSPVNSDFIMWHSVRLSFTSKISRLKVCFNKAGSEGDR